MAATKSLVQLDTSLIQTLCREVTRGTPVGELAERYALDVEVVRQATRGAAK